MYENITSYFRRSNHHGCDETITSNILELKKITHVRENMTLNIKNISRIVDFLNALLASILLH